MDDIEERPLPEPDPAEIPLRRQIADAIEDLFKARRKTVAKWHRDLAKETGQPVDEMRKELGL